MTQQIIYVGAAPNDGDGDPIRTAFIKTNDNFSELYARVQVDAPSTLIGKAGDEIGYYAPTADYFYYCFANYNGSSVIWAQITALGNISATKIQNGTSVVQIIDLNGNANVNINGTSNVAVFATLSASVIVLQDEFRAFEIELHRRHCRVCGGGNNCRTDSSIRGDPQTFCIACTDYKVKSIRRPNQKFLSYRVDIGNIVVGYPKRGAADRGPLRRHSNRMG